MFRLGLDRIYSWSPAGAEVSIRIFPKQFEPCDHMLLLMCSSTGEVGYGSLCTRATPRSQAWMACTMSVR